MRCGVEGSQVSDGGDSHVFTFGWRISDFFFPSVHGLRTVLLQGCGSLFFFLLLDFWNKSFWNVFFKVKLMTVLDIFQTNVFVFPLFFFRHMDICLTWFGFYTVIVLILCQLDFVSKGYVFACNFIIMWILCFDFWSVIVDV